MNGRTEDGLLGFADRWLTARESELISWRRDLHSHPEIAWNEHRTTERIEGLLTSFGLAPVRAAVGTGLWCDIGVAEGAEMVGLRADIDALPLTDTKSVHYTSVNAGACHACGHDVHTAILLACAAVLAEAHRNGALSGGVRLIFQPAEERTPGGAAALVEEGVLTGVRSIFALHCDPKLDAGQVGLRPGAITAAFNQVEVTLKGPGGHTARPHLTSDVVYALGKVITELPGLLSRRVDPRSVLSLVWGAVSAGSVPNAIPNTGTLKGTLRMLDGQLWHDLEPIVRDLLASIVAPTGAGLEVAYDRGVPAVINDAALVAAQTAAALRAFGTEGVADTQQSMGGEDFAWYLQEVPGAMARLGVRRPGSIAGDLHQPDFDIDEHALAVGVRFTAAVLDELAVRRRATGPANGTAGL